MPKLSGVPVLSRIALSWLLASVVFVVNACGGGGDTPTAPELTINIESASIELNGSVQLSARNAPGVVTWSSSNPSVATVISTGFVQAVGPGVTTITAASGSQTASSTVTVLAPPAIGLASSAVSFTARAGSTNPAAQTVAITNGGPGTLQGIAVSDVQYASGQPAGWLTATVSGASASVTQTSSLQLAAAVAGLNPGAYTATVVISASGASNSPQSVAVSFTVTARPTIELSATSAVFSAVSGAANPAPTIVNVTSAVPAQATGLVASIVYNEPAQSGWLTATLNGSTTPATLTLQAAAGARPAGTYSATVTVSSPDASNSPRQVPVTFAIAPAPRIDLNTAALAFGAALGAGNPAAQLVQITNGGGGTLSALAASIQYTTGAGWLTATLNATANAGTVTVTPAIAGLAAGTYTANVRITAAGASNSPRDVAVTLIISSQPTIAVAPTSLTFTSSGPAPAAQLLTISNSGGGTLAGLTASAQYTGTAGWLTLTLNTAGASPTLTVQPSTTGLAAGTYSATVNIASPGASNTPLAVPVSLTVTTPPSIVLSASSRTFSAVIGEADPFTQAVTITNGGGGVLNGLSTNIVYAVGSGWLTATLNTTTATATLTLGAARGALSVGTYSATVNVTSPVASNSPRAITVTFTVTQPTIVLGNSAPSFSKASGTGAAPALAIPITNGGGGDLTGLTAQIISYAGPVPNTGWLTATLNGTAAPTTVTLTANAGTPGAPRAPGTYTATVRIASPVAGNSPRDISVTFNVLVSLANNLFNQVYTDYCSSCHFAGGSYPNLSSVTLFRNNMVNVTPTANTATYPLAATYTRVIVAGNASQSYLKYMLNKAAGARPMPASALSTVPQNLRELMDLWINQGANNN